MIACAALPALADGPDFRTGISPYGAATPVPAPIPVPFEEAAWYFRADFAAGFGSQPSVNSFGTPFGSGTRRDDRAQPFVAQQKLRACLHRRRWRRLRVGSALPHRLHGRHPLLDECRLCRQHRLQQRCLRRRSTCTDKTKFASTVLLVNGYYDIRTGTPFSPYIGGGVGFTVDQLTQEIAANDTGSALGLRPSAAARRRSNSPALRWQA